MSNKGRKKMFLLNPLNLMMTKGCSSMVECSLIVQWCRKYLPALHMGVKNLTELKNAATSPTGNL